MKFFIFALPRSGTAWLSNLLTYGNSFCYHDPSSKLGGMQNALQMMSDSQYPCVGMADTALTVFSEMVVQDFPESLFIAIQRDAMAVKDSLTRNNIPISESALMLAEIGLRNVIREQSPIVINFDDLFQNPDALTHVWLRITGGQDFNLERWEMLCKLQVQVHPVKAAQEYARLIRESKSI